MCANVASGCLTEAQKRFIDGKLELSQARKEWSVMTIGEKLSRLNEILSDVDESMTESASCVGFGPDGESQGYNSGELVSFSSDTLEEKLDTLSKLAYDLEALAEAVRMRVTPEKVCLIGGCR